MARGDRREEIFRDNRDRSKFVGDLAGGAERYRVKVHCYVLTENHFHLVATTPEGNLSQWMHQLKTAYTLSGVFAERLEKDSALLRKVSLVQEALELR
jgi:hypothetical protein